MLWHEMTQEKPKMQSDSTQNDVMKLACYLYAIWWDQADQLCGCYVFSISSFKLINFDEINVFFFWILGKIHC